MALIGKSGPQKSNFPYNSDQLCFSLPRKNEANLHQEGYVCQTRNSRSKKRGVKLTTRVFCFASRYEKRSFAFRKTARSFSSLLYWHYLKLGIETLLSTLAFRSIKNLPLDIYETAAATFASTALSVKRS